MIDTRATTPPRFVPFAYGFRPFFFAALCYAAVSVVAWVWIRASGALPLASLPPSLWHGHEMLFGFIGAAIAGFLLTAVPSWTASRGFAGWPLVLVSAAWLAGRIGFALAAFMPIGMLALLELLFLPALAVLIAPPLLRAWNRNTPLLMVLLVLWLVDATFLYAVALPDLNLASTTILVGIDIVLVMITVIGGRIVPAFTAKALRRRGITAPVRSQASLEVATILSMVAIAVGDAMWPGSGTAGTLAALAAMLHVGRLAGWQGRHSLKEPLVWVLHSAYLWLALGLALKALFLLGNLDWASQWLHALTIGGAAAMVMAVITRAALGHTGRPLTVSRGIVTAYVLLSVATLARVFVSAFSVDREWLVRTSALLWVIAFAIVLVIYTPILVRPRLDGKPG